MKVKVLIGNVASGKSTYVGEQSDCFVISKDDWRKVFAVLIGKEYLFEDTLEEFIHDIIVDLYEACLHIGVTDIIIDETHETIKIRNPFISLAKKYGYETEAIVFPDLGKKIHVDRRMKDNHGTDSDGCTREIWEEVYDRKKSIYQEPTKEEFNNIIYK